MTNVAPPSMPARPAPPFEDEPLAAQLDPTPRAARAPKPKKKQPRAPRPKRTEEQRRAADEAALARATAKVVRLRFRLSGKLSDAQLRAACVRAGELLGKIQLSAADYGFSERVNGEYLFTAPTAVLRTIVESIDASLRSRATTAYHEEQHALAQESKS